MVELERKHEIEIAHFSTVWRFYEFVYSLIFSLELTEIGDLEEQPEMPGYTFTTRILLYVIFKVVEENHFEINSYF